MESQSWIFWAMLSAFFAAATGISAKMGVVALDSSTATLFRTCVVLGLLIAIVTAKGSWESCAKIDFRSAIILTFSGLATGLSWLCYFQAMKVGEASLVASVDKLSVVMLAVIAFAFLGERLSSIQWFGILAIAGGSVLVAVGGK
ncbi:EamA-like transporter family protein [Pirellula sp. SH-Sr6A]|uniref:EamA family transporter n=1 Tax=Pirellula sp. SH-Sr6A TaxID=1632865 RepID=UPI00078DE1EC|nr:EamA family transporter [Pirellula sp. SH-Sr6A]AMV35286.1 EamA-like transporter family protein [Pirellula sp. SH-Sr6A]